MISKRCLQNLQSSSHLFAPHRIAIHTEACEGADKCRWRKIDRGERTKKKLFLPPLAAMRRRRRHNIGGIPARYFHQSSAMFYQSQIIRFASHASCMYRETRILKKRARALFSLPSSTFNKYPESNRSHGQYVQVSKKSHNVPTLQFGK